MPKAKTPNTIKYDIEPTSLSGTTVPYKGDGRRLGYPTANIASKTSLEDGVYLGFADMAGFSHHTALIFIGTPTTMGETERRVEAYLLDIPDQDYYDHQLELELVHYVRPNQTFKSVDDLKLQMLDDEKYARQWFAKNT